MFTLRQKAKGAAQMVVPCFIIAYLSALPGGCSCRTAMQQLQRTATSAGCAASMPVLGCCSFSSSWQTLCCVMSATLSAVHCTPRLCVNAATLKSGKGLDIRLACCLVSQLSEPALLNLVRSARLHCCQLLSVQSQGDNCDLLSDGAHAVQCYQGVLAAMTAGRDKRHELAADGCRSKPQLGGAATLTQQLAQKLLRQGVTLVHDWHRGERILDCCIWPACAAFHSHEPGAIGPDIDVASQERRTSQHT